MKSFRLVGKDFQSWKSFDFTVSGFTVVVGSSNKGKTALVRALRGILRNQLAEAHVRKGQKVAEVSIEVEDGPSASATRNAKTTTYKIGEEDYAKLAGDVPEPLKALQTHVISVGNTKLDPIFAGQFDSQFMMDLTPSDLNAVFGLFSSTERLNNGKKEIAASNTEINSHAKILATQIQASEAKLASIQILEKEFRELVETHQTAESRKSLLEEQVGELSKWKTSTTLANEYRTLTNLSLPTTQHLLQQCSYGRLLQAYQEVRELTETLRAVTSFTKPENWDNKTSTYSFLISYKTQLNQHKLIPRTPSTSTQKVAGLWEVFQALKAFRDTKLSIKAIPVRVSISVEGLNSTQGVITALTEFKSLLTSRGSLTAKLATISEDLGNSHLQLHDLTADTMLCPNCGFQIRKD